MMLLRWLIRNSHWVLNNVGATFSVTNDFTANTVISSSAMNTNFSDVETAINAIETYIGNGVITGAMLATITTAGKISGAALTLLANTPSGAGVLPEANVGQAEGNDIFMSSGAKSLSGWTEITATYSGRFLRVGSTGLSTGSHDALTAHTHTFTGDALATHGHTFIASQTLESGETFNVATGTQVSISNAIGTTSAGTPAGTNASTGSGSNPTYVDVRLWQKD